MTNAIKFLDTTYFQTATPAALNLDAIGTKWATLETMTGPQLVSLHNLVASNIGANKVNRFADASKGRDRTWKVLQLFQAEVDADAGQEAFTPARALQSLGISTSVLSPVDKVAVTAEAASRKAPAKKREPQAGAIRAPRAPKPDDGAIRMPTEGGKKRAKRQRDGSYAFRIPAGKPRTQVVSEQREELLGLLVSGTTWQGIKDEFGKDDFRTVTTVTMFCITLGYGVETQADGSIKLLEPLA